MILLSFFVMISLNYILLSTPSRNIPKIMQKRGENPIWDTDTSRTHKIINTEYQYSLKPVLSAKRQVNSNTRTGERSYNTNSRHLSSWRHVLRKVLPSFPTRYDFARKLSVLKDIFFFSFALIFLTYVIQDENRYSCHYYYFFISHFFAAWPFSSDLCGNNQRLTRKRRKKEEKEEEVQKKAK